LLLLQEKSKIREVFSHSSCYNDRVKRFIGLTPAQIALLAVTFALFVARDTHAGSDMAAE
jgi:hypothetical protein